MPPVRWFGRRLRALRAARDLTQEALANRAKISRVYVAQLERGRQDPTLSVLLRLARALKVDVAHLVKKEAASARRARRAAGRRLA